MGKDPKHSLPKKPPTPKKADEKKTAHKAEAKSFLRPVQQLFTKKETTAIKASTTSVHSNIKTAEDEDAKTGMWYSVIKKVDEDKNTKKKKRDTREDTKGGTKEDIKPSHSIEPRKLAKIQRCLQGKIVPEHFVQQVDFEICIDKEDQMGVVIKDDLVLQVLPGSIAQCYLLPGDILVSCNGFNFTDKQEENSKFLRELVKKGHKKAKFEVMRLKKKLPADWALLPGYQKVDGMEYYQVLLYSYKSMHIGLDVRVVDEKLLVERVRDRSSAAVGLGMGDRILEHEGSYVGKPHEFSQKLEACLNEKGWSRMTVEVAVTDRMRNFVRSNLLDRFGLPTEGGLPLEVEIGLPADAAAMALKTLKWWTDPPGNKRKPPCPILRENSETAKHSVDKVNFGEKAELLPIPIDSSIRLLTKTPGKNKFDATQKKIISNFQESDSPTTFSREAIEKEGKGAKK